MTEETVMEHDEYYWLSLFSLLAVTVVILVLGGCKLHHLHVEKMAELGYQKESIVGAEYPEWRKVGGQ